MSNTTRMTAILAEKKRAEIVSNVESLMQLVRTDTENRVTIAAQERSDAEQQVLDAAYALRIAREEGSSMQQEYRLRALSMAANNLQLPSEAHATV